MHPMATYQLAWNPENSRRGVPLVLFLAVVVEPFARAARSGSGTGTRRLVRGERAPVPIAAHLHAASGADGFVLLVGWRQEGTTGLLAGPIRSAVPYVGTQGSGGQVQRFGCSG